jgi:hypothetical protein
MDRIEKFITITVVVLCGVLWFASPIANEKHKRTQRLLNDYICQKAVMRVER